MKVFDPGHRYMLDMVDSRENLHQSLRFVKRVGEKYPGNESTYPGVLLQEVFRACIDRCSYLDNQAPCWETKMVRYLLRRSLQVLENRTRRRRFQDIIEFVPEEPVELEPTCPKCGHIRCLNHT